MSKYTLSFSGLTRESIKKFNVKKDGSSAQGRG